MNQSATLSYLLFLSFSILTSATQAEVMGIPAGSQLQEQAEQKTSFINTQKLKHLLDKEPSARLGLQLSYNV